MVKIASFNINGIKARTNALMTWLSEEKPDVALLQEIKSVGENFPSDLFENLGYNVEVSGQKSFNGVAILSKFPLEDVVCQLPGDTNDDQARWMEATIVCDQSIRICNLYLPNGNPTPGPKYEYKFRRVQPVMYSAAPSLTRAVGGSNPPTPSSLQPL